MKLPKNFVENIFNNISAVGLSCPREVEKILVLFSYSLIREYHDALKDELNKSGIDIGDLEIDHSFE